MPFDYDTDKPSMQASVQAGALEELAKDSAIKSMERSLAAQGAAAMQPKGKALPGLSTMMDEGGEDYSEVEPEEPGEF